LFTIQYDTYLHITNVQYTAGNRESQEKHTFFNPYALKVT